MFWRHPVRRLLSAKDEALVLDAIRAAEAASSGEIRVHMARRCRGDARAEAERWFVRLGMQSTTDRNGVLFFVGVEDRRFAVVGDRGIHERVGDAFWDTIRQGMEDDFREGEFARGLARAVERVGRELARAFPRRPDDRNELPDAVSIDDGSDG